MRYMLFMRSEYTWQWTNVLPTTEDLNTTRDVWKLILYYADRDGCNGVAIIDFKGQHPVLTTIFEKRLYAAIKFWKEKLQPRLFDNKGEPK